MAAPDPPLTAALHPTVVAHADPDSDYALGPDLDELGRVRAVGADVAAVLLAARILEATARDALRSTVAPGPQLADNLDLLTRYGGLPGAAKVWADRLRWLGNDARHANRPLGPADADAAFVILLRWLRWRFCEAPAGPRLSAMTAANVPLDALLPAATAGLFDALDRAELTGGDLLARLDLTPNPRNLVLLTPVVPAVVAERLIGRGLLGEADRVLAAARRAFPMDLRLAQLAALSFARRFDQSGQAGPLSTARDLLERRLPVGAGGPDDEETFGILAGVYKRLGDHTGGAGEWLAKSHETYRRGWAASGRANTYLGINAAATGRCRLDRLDDAAELAEEVADALALLAERLSAGRPGWAELDYWHAVTRAEAQLLRGDLETAGELYRTTFARFPARVGDIASTRRQAARLLDQLAQAERTVDVLGE